MSMLTFPEKIQDREKYILDQVVSGNFDAGWVHLEYEVNGKKVNLRVTPDALKVGGVRVNVSASLQQQLADIFDASLLTAQVADLMFLKSSHTLGPSPQPISSSVLSMVSHSDRVTKMLGSYQGGIVSPVGKHWILDKKLEYTRNRACNYGWHFTGLSFKGIKGFPSASQYRKTLDGKSINVIQPNATAHDSKHSDYSQTCQLVLQQCWIDGVEHRFSDILQNPSLCNLINHNGTLKNIRQPDVPQLSSQKIILQQVV